MVFDIAYVTATIAFFSLMFAFVCGLESLGREGVTEGPERT